MINLHNYALLAEQKKYGYSSLITESIDAVNEAGPDMQTADGLNKVMGGKTDPNYTAQWNQLVDDIASRKKVAGTYTVTIKHDDNREMVTLEYQIGADGKPIKTSVKLADTAATGQNVSIDKLAAYNPKGKMNEFIAALITVSIEKFGKAWTKAHIDWVNGQINKCKALGGFYGNIASSANGVFLKGTGDIFTTWISPLSGGDRPTQIDAIANTNKIAGSAATDAQVNMILQTINVKIQESIIGSTDETAIHGLYMLISPKYTTGQLDRMYSAIAGQKDGVLSAMSRSGAANDNLTYKKPFAQWCVGVRGNQYSTETLTRYGFDLASYTASLAAIKSALV